MHPPPCATCLKASPGLIDRSSSCCSSAVVTQEKTKRQKAAALKADESHCCAARVAEVEREVKKAQGEAQAVRQGGGGKIAKKNIPTLKWEGERKFSDPSH